MNIVIPMAGKGSRFANAGYSLPKPLIPVMDHKPMIQMVIESIPNRDKHKFIFIVQREHIDKYHIDAMLRILVPKCAIVVLDEITEGAACTVLKARRWIENTDPMLIINSDLYIPNFKLEKQGNIIYTIESVHPSFSFVKTVQMPSNWFGYDSMVTEVTEKIPISNRATIGAYQWDEGVDFVRLADQMIAADRRFNNEFYVAPVYNEALNQHMLVYERDVKQFWSLGTPEELNYFWMNYKK